ncbi:BOI-related E3 ubiquitin-protein ligase 1 [Capsicum chacoense]
MAVQAQYPSNVHLFNRSVQERKSPLGKDDYSLQPQPGGGSILDHTQMLFNPGAGSNRSCKRRREISAHTGTTTAMNALVSFQSQPQVIDLTQLQTHPQHQPNVVSTGLRLASGEQLQQYQQHQLQQQYHHQQHSLSPQSSQSSAFYSILSEDMSTIIKQHRDEIEQFLHVQREQLRRTLEEQRRTHYRALLGTAEESMARQLKEKEAEVTKAARRNAELEARAAQLSAEAQAWQARARAEEFTAATLQAQLQQAMVNGGGCDGDVAGSGGGGGSGEAEDAESAYIDPDRVVESTGPSCKACRKRVASVVLLPCRHLCLCTDCDGVVQACPLCLSVTTSSVEVFFC